MWELGSVVILLRIWIFVSLLYILISTLIWIN